MTSVTSSSHVVSVASTQPLTASSKQTSQSTSPNVKVFDKEPPKDFTGMVPAYFFKFVTGSEDGITAGAIKFLNTRSLKTESLADLVKCGQLACVIYEQGVAKQVCLAFTWAGRLKERNATKILLNSDGDVYRLIEGVTVTSLKDESYSKMARICLPYVVQA